MCASILNRSVMSRRTAPSRDDVPTRYYTHWESNDVDFYRQDPRETFGRFDAKDYGTHIATALTKLKKDCKEAVNHLLPLMPMVNLIEKFGDGSELGDADNETTAEYTKWQNILYAREAKLTAFRVCMFQMLYDIKRYCFTRSELRATSILNNNRLAATGKEYLGMIVHNMECSITQNRYQVDKNTHTLLMDTPFLVGTKAALRDPRAHINEKMHCFQRWILEILSAYKKYEDDIYSMKNVRRSDIARSINALVIFYNLWNNDNVYRGERPTPNPGIPDPTKGTLGSFKGPQGFDERDSAFSDATLNRGLFWAVMPPSEHQRVVSGMPVESIIVECRLTYPKFRAGAYPETLNNDTSRWFNANIAKHTRATNVEVILTIQYGQEADLDKYTEVHQFIMQKFYGHKYMEVFPFYAKVTTPAENYKDFSEAGLVWDIHGFEGLCADIPDRNTDNMIPTEVDSICHILDVLKSKKFHADVPEARDIMRNLCQTPDAFQKEAARVFHSVVNPHSGQWILTWFATKRFIVGVQIQLPHPRQDSGLRRNKEYENNDAARQALFTETVPVPNVDKAIESVAVTPSRGVPVGNARNWADDVDANGKDDGKPSDMTEANKIPVPPSNGRAAEGDIVQHAPAPSRNSNISYADACKRPKEAAGASGAGKKKEEQQQVVKVTSKWDKVPYFIFFHTRIEAGGDENADAPFIGVYKFIVVADDMRFNREGCYTFEQLYVHNGRQYRFVTNMKSDGARIKKWYEKQGDDDWTEPVDELDDEEPKPESFYPIYKMRLNCKFPTRGNEWSGFYNIDVERSTQERYPVWTNSGKGAYQDPHPEWRNSGRGKYLCYRDGTLCIAEGDDMKPVWYRNINPRKPEHELFFPLRDTGNIYWVPPNKDYKNKFEMSIQVNINATQTGPIFASTPEMEEQRLSLISVVASRFQLGASLPLQPGKLQSKKKTQQEDMSTAALRSELQTLKQSMDDIKMALHKMARR